LQGAEFAGEEEERVFGWARCAARRLVLPRERASTKDVFGSIELGYKAALNALGLAIFVALFVATIERPSSDPACCETAD
jgi:hypothetical protein